MCKPPSVRGIRHHPNYGRTKTKHVVELGPTLWSATQRWPIRPRAGRTESQRGRSKPTSGRIRPRSSATPNPIWSKRAQMSLIGPGGTSVGSEGAVGASPPSCCDEANGLLTWSCPWASREKASSLGASSVLTSQRPPKHDGALLRGNFIRPNSRTSSRAVIPAGRNNTGQAADPQQVSSI